MINRKLQSNKNIYKAGSNTERYVFDKVNEYFKGRQFLSFLNYPVYSIEANRYWIYVNILDTKKLSFQFFFECINVILYKTVGLDMESSAGTISKPRS